MRAILSIKPKYVKEILKGTKKYELRKKVFKRDVNEVYIYASSPTKKIVATFKIGKIIESDPIGIWEQLNPYLGINKKDYLEYFHKSSTAFAIEITDLKPFEPLDPKKLIEDFNAPQSYSYISSTMAKEIEPVKISPIHHFLMSIKNYFLN